MQCLRVKSKHVRVYCFTIFILPYGQKLYPSGVCFWLYVLALFVRKHIFPENQKSWPKAMWELATRVWFRILQNIPNVRARWAKKTVAWFCFRGSPFLRIWKRGASFDSSLWLRIVREKTLKNLKGERGETDWDGCHFTDVYLCQ